MNRRGFIGALLGAPIAAKLAPLVAALPVAAEAAPEVVTHYFPMDDAVPVSSGPMQIKDGATYSFALDCSDPRNPRMWRCDENGWERVA